MPTIYRLTGCAALSSHSHPGSAGDRSGSPAPNIYEAGEQVFPVVQTPSVRVSFSSPHQRAAPEVWCILREADLAEDMLGPGVDAGPGSRELQATGYM